VVFLTLATIKGKQQQKRRMIFKPRLAIRGSVAEPAFLSAVA
jgi:hypothetical protein